MKWRTVWVVVGAAAAVPACSLFGTVDFNGNGSGGGGGGTTPGTGGVTTSSTSSTASTGGASSTSSTTSTSSSTTSSSSSSSTTSSSGTGGGSVSSCTALRLEVCTQMKACAPSLYLQNWENNDALCQSEAVRLCTALPSAYDDTVSGVVDPVACKTALSGTCATYLAAIDQPPAACQPALGTKTVDQGCLLTTQCGAGLGCYGGGPASCSEYCGPVGTAGRACAPGGAPLDVLCDPRNGLHCLQGTAGNGSDMEFLCRTVTYAAAGAACTVNADAQCQSGLTCSTSGTGVLKGTCVALLQAGAACTTTMLGANTQDPCDTRLGLHCEATDLNHPTAGSTCQPAYVVPDNATCGMVVDGSVLHNHVCGDYSYCNGSSLCQAKVMPGQGCVANGCYPPYQCTVGSCQAPAVQVDPPCTKVGVNQIACGETPGGLYQSCTSACCMTYDTTTFTYVPGCGTIGACPSGSDAELDCEDSSACAAGNKCCLKFTASPSFVKAVCTPTASCDGFEVCRLDGATPCGGGTCTPGEMDQSSDWVGITPDNVGFCSPPTCTAPGYGCNANSQCCSGSCDIAQQACN